MQILSDTKIMLQDRSFLKKAVIIAFPVAMQGMLNTIVNMVDNIMIANLGASAIAAVGLANKLFFVYTLLLFGVVSGSGVLAAQYWGNKDIKNIRKVLGLALTIAIMASFLFFVAARFIPEKVMRIFTLDPQSIRLGAAYLVIVAFSYPFTAFSTTCVAMLRATNRVKEPVIISMCTIVVNIIGNYMFIFGHFGAPAMGVAGAAVGTVIARILEALAITILINFGKTAFACHVKELFGFSAAFVKQFISTAFPVIANEFMWGLGTTIYSMAYGRMGNEAVAAITVATAIQDVVIVVFQGISAATAVVLGNEMGAGKLEKAERYAKNFLILQFIITMLTGLFCYATRWNFIAIFGEGISGTVADLVNKCIIAFVLFMPFKMFNYVNIVGVLRSGGDTKMSLFIDTSGVWLIGIPLAFLGGLVLKQPIYIVYAMVMLEEIYKMIIGFIRYKQKKWLRNLAVELNA